MEAIEGKLIIMSDVHLRCVDDDRGRLFLDTLDRINPESCEYLVLNGDIFDFCFGPSNYYRKKFKPVGDALGKLASQGVEVIFVEGNHEFRIPEIGWQGVRFVDEIVLALSDGTRVRICHGDLIKNDFWYRLYRGLVKSRLAGIFAKYLPQAWFDRLCLRYASQSRARDDYRELDRHALYSQLKHWLGQGRFDYGVVGHFHVPFAEPGSQGTLLSVDSWDKPNVLVVSAAGAQRIWLTQPGAALHIEAVQSILGLKDS